MRETVQVLPVGIDATRKKPGDRFRNAIGMTDAVMDELRGTPGGTRHEAAVHRILAENKVQHAFCTVRISGRREPFVCKEQRKRVVCNFAVGTPYEPADRKPVSIFGRKLHNLIRDTL